MKVSGNGQGKILTAVLLRLLFTDGFTTSRDRALFGICLFTGCRVSGEKTVPLIKIPRHYLGSQDEDSITIDVPESMLLRQVAVEGKESDNGSSPVQMNYTRGKS